MILRHCLGLWASWGQWSLCSVTCGLGKEQRYRKCKLTKHEFRHADTIVKCEGSRKSTRSCITAACGLYSFVSWLKATLLPEAILMSTNYNPLDWKLNIPVCRQKLICIQSVVVIFQRYMITKSFLFIREYIFSYIIPLINGVGFIEKGFNQILNNLTMFNNVSQKYQMSFFNCRESSQTYQ